MKKIYLSNFLRFLTDGKKLALYNGLTGSVIILSKIISIDKMGKELLERLEKEKFIFRDVIGSYEEEILYDDYFIVPNREIFSSWKRDRLQLFTPENDFLGGISLSKEDGELWLSLFQREIKYKEVKESLMNLNNINNYHNLLYKLQPDGERKEQCIFENRYLKRFHCMDPKLLSHQTESCKSIYLKLTDSCNLHCSMCGQAINRKTGLVKEKNFLDFSTIKEFFNPIIEKINYVNLWGGEPCMHPQFLEYVKYFKDNGKYVSIATNGTFLEKYGEAMVKYGVDEIVVSVDGPRSIHNKIRGGHNAFERSEEGIKKVMEFKKHKQIKPKIYINCTVVEDNVKYLQDVLEWSRIINVNKLMFQLPMFFSEAQVQEYEDICIRSWGICAKSPRGFLGNYNIDTEKLFNFYTKVMREHRDIADFYNFRFNNEREMEKYFSEPENNLGRARCVVLDSTLVVEANGDLVMCPDFPDVIYGNIYDKNQECISSEIRENFIAGFKKYSGYPICSRCCQLI